MTYIPPNSNGIAAATASSPIVSPVRILTSGAKTSAAVGYEFLTDTTNGWMDTLGYGWISFSVATSGTSSGILYFECTNDTTLAPAGFPMQMHDNASSTVGRVTLYNVGTNASKHYTGPIPARYIRIRTYSAITSVGGVTVTTHLRQAPVLSPFQSVSITSPLPTSSVGIGKFGLASATNMIGYTHAATTMGTIMNQGLSSSATYGYSMNSGPSSAAFQLSVSQVSGSNQTLDLVLTETIGNEEVDLYHFERVTGDIVIPCPTLRITGRSVSYRSTISGTESYFYIVLSRIERSAPGESLRRVFDRTFTTTQSVGSTTAVYYAQSTNQVQMVIVSSATSTPSAFTIQGSNDKQNWYDISVPITTVSNETTTTTFQTHQASWIRAYCTIAGSGQTLAYISFTMIGPSGG